MNKRGNVRAQATKALIQESLTTLLFDSPLSSITVSALCKKANINRSTFYSHYSDLRGVLGDIENSFFTRLRDTVEGGNRINYNDRLEAYLTYLYENKSVYLLLFRSDTSFVDRFHDFIVNMYGKAKHREGSIEKDELFKIAFVTGGGLYIIDRWMHSDEDIPARKVAEKLNSVAEIVITADIGG